MQKWEYCVVYGLMYDGGTSHPRCYLLTSDGLKLVEDFKKRPRGMKEHDAVAQFIARLGDEGWEIAEGVGVTMDSRYCLYFKRPKKE